MKWSKVVIEGLPFMVQTLTYCISNEILINSPQTAQIIPSVGEVSV